MHTVKRAAELVGIAPETLRMWERRYGVVEPARSDSGYRLYDDAALRRLVRLKALVDAGWRPAQAARHVLAGTTPAPDPTDEGPDPAPPERENRGPDVGVLARVAGDFDAEGLGAVLDEAFREGAFEDVVDSWLMPAMAEVGRSWRSGEVTIAGEHFVSATVQRRLAAELEAAGPSAGGPAVVIGLARGSRHELGVLAFAAALRRAGLTAVYVGADLPPEEWVATVRGRGAAAVVLGVPVVEDVPAVRETVQALASEDPHRPVFLGGAHQDVVGAPGRPLGHGIGPAAREVAAHLAAGDEARVPGA